MNNQENNTKILNERELLPLNQELCKALSAEELEERLETGCAVNYGCDTNEGCDINH